MELSPAQEYGLRWALFFFILVAAKIYFFVSRIGPIMPLLLLVEPFEPIRDTIESKNLQTL